MKVKIKRLLVVFICLAMVLTTLLGDGILVNASEESMIFIPDVVDLVAVPGETAHLALPIQTNERITVSNILVSSTSSDFKFTRPVLKVNGSLAGYITIGLPTSLEFDVTTIETATIKNNYPITIKFDYYNYTTDAEGSYEISTILKVNEERIPAQLTVNDVKLDSTNIGSDAILKFTVRNEGEITAKNTYLSMDFGSAIEKKYSTKNIKVGDLAKDEAKEMSLPISILNSASVGKNALTANFTYKSVSGDPSTSSYSINVNLTSNIKSPNLSVIDAQSPDIIKAGNDFNLTLVLKNIGTGEASDITVAVNAASITQDGVLTNYHSDGISASDILGSKQGTVKIPLKVSKYATSGIKNVVVDITYRDDAGNKYSESKTIYLDISGSGTTPSGSSNIVISNVVQSPEQPEAGDKVNITFTVENKSKADANEFKIYADGLTAATFIPVNADPYKYIDNLAAGDKVRITIPLIVSTSITEGLNNLTIKYSYNGGEGSTILPVRNVKNDIGSSSIPKLIISNYSTDTDELKAGSTFNLTYSIYNTNASVAAKNITVTITQADNIFTVTQGSNSTFINKMGPGETIENTLELKVKSDATTKAYPITITIEYEYEGITPNTETGEVGIKKTETLNLNAEENARPVVDNVSVNAWDGTVMVGGTATLAFEFYNMGKAVLNNVVATVEGDGYTKADGSMFFVGNVEAGASSYVEFDVIPNYEGTAAGTLKISYEDSNGETIEFTKEFSQEVMPASTVDPGIPDDGSGEVNNPEVTIVKKDIMPIWAFVLILLAIFAIFVPVTRKAIISVYKSKLRRKEHEQY